MTVFNLLQNNPKTVLDASYQWLHNWTVRTASMSIIYLNYFIDILMALLLRLFIFMTCKCRRRDFSVSSQQQCFSCSVLMISVFLTPVTSTADSQPVTGWNIFKADLLCGAEAGLTWCNIASISEHNLPKKPENHKTKITVAHLTRSHKLAVAVSTPTNDTLEGINTMCIHNHQSIISVIVNSYK